MENKALGYNQKYMSIGVSVLIAKFSAHKKGGAARQESNPQFHQRVVSNEKLIEPDNKV